MSTIAPARQQRTPTIKRLAPDSPEDTLTLFFVLLCVGAPVWVVLFAIGTYFC